MHSDYTDCIMRIFKIIIRIGYLVGILSVDQVRTEESIIFTSLVYWLEMEFAIIVFFFLRFD